MKTLITPAALCCLFLGLSLEATGGSLAKNTASRLNREGSAVYLEDLPNSDGRFTLKVTDSAVAYSTLSGELPLGTFLPGATVKLVAFTERAARVRGRAAHGDIVGWVGLNRLQGIEGAVFDRLRAASKRQEEVDKLIAEKEIAIGMTMDEVSRSLGRPVEKSSQVDKQGTYETWSFIAYERVPQQTLTVDAFGRPVWATVFVKRETGRLNVTFEKGLVARFDGAQQARHRDQSRRIIVPPITIF